MDYNVRFSAFQCEVINQGDAELSDVLQGLAAARDRNAYVEVAGGARLRLEGFEVGPPIVGEIVRQQNENIPPFAHDGAPLEGNLNPLGHRSVFLYDAPNSCLVLEMNRQAITPGRLSSFVRIKCPGHRGFYFHPMLTDDALERLVGARARKFEVRVARPVALPDGASPGDIEDKIDRLKEILGSTAVTISWGYNPGPVDREEQLSVGMLRRLVQWARRNPHAVTKAEVKLAEEDYPINMLGDQITSVVTLEWPEGDLAASLVARQQAIRQFHRERRNLIRRLYGGA